MAISDLFRPKHRHSDPAVRTEAVRALSADSDDDVVMLASIARDDEAPEVRRLAIEKIEDADLLAEVARADSEPALRSLATKRATELWVSAALGGTREVFSDIAPKLALLDGQRGLVELAISASDPARRNEAFDRIDTPAAVARLARSGAPTHIRLLAVAQVSDADVLKSVAIDGTSKDVALAALERIADHDVVEHIATRGKVKAVRARARKILDEANAATDLTPETIDSSTDEERRLYAERIQLCRIAEEIAGRHEWVESITALEKAEEAWSELGAGVDWRLSERFREAAETYRTRREKYGAADIARASADSTHEQPENKVEKSIGQQPEPDATGMAVDVATTEGSGDVQIVVEPVAPSEPAVEVAAAEAASASPAESGDATARVDGAPAAEPTQANKTKAERDADTLKELVRLVADLESADNVVKLKTGDRKLQKTQADFEKLAIPSSTAASELVARYEAAHKKLFIRVQEMREADEWQRWANVPKREALVAKARELAEAEPTENLGNQLRELQAAWKAVGPVPQKRGQELWDDFKATCDAIYDKVKVQRAAQQEVRKANLQQKLELCEQVEALKDSTDWQTAANEIKRLQVAWKKIGQVPRKQSDAVWKRFRGACDHFFERRKPHLEKSLGDQQHVLERKIKMCERAEQLAETASEPADWRDGANELKRMQRDWRTMGHVPRKDANAINKRFRAASDAFFNKRQAHFDALDAEKAKRIDELEQGIDAVAKGEGEPAERVARALELRSAVLSAKAPRARLKELTEKLRLAHRAVVESCAEQVKGTELDPAVNMKRMEKLVKRAEKLAPKDAPVAAAKTAAEMAEQLRRAFSANALGGVDSNTGGRPASEIVAELRESWSRLGPVPGADGDALEARFETACKQAAAKKR